MLVQVSFLILLALTNAEHLSRTKRNLIFTPTNNIVQLILGTGIPVPLEDQQALTVGWVFKAAYFTPNNASFFTNPYVAVAKRSIDDDMASRFDIYRSIEAAFQVFGGKGCMLRALCENAQTPFRTSGLLDQILHIIFTPGTTDESATESRDQIYEAAAELGRKEQTSCARMFPECKKSLLDIISTATLPS